MLDRLLPRSIRLELGLSTLKFRSKRDLELVLSGKTAPSALKTAELGRLSDEELIRAVNSYRDLERRIVNALAQKKGVETLLNDLDLALITEDNDWRAVFRGLRTLDSSADEYKHCALLKFMEYLTLAQQLANTIRGDQRGPIADAGSLPALTSEAGGLGENFARQTLVVELNRLLTVDDQIGMAHDEEFNRMPKGESLEVKFGSHQSLNILMARHNFIIVSGDPYLLVDENGNDLKLGHGKNIVGRGALCDVTLDPAFKAVSRKHLIIELSGSGVVKLTDISTMGTFVPREYLDNRLH